MLQIMHQDEKRIKQTESIKLSKKLNSKTAIVRMDKSFVSVIKALLNSMGALGQQYRMMLWKALIKGTVEDELLSYSLSTCVRSQHPLLVLYKAVGKVFGRLFFSRSYTPSVRTEKTLGSLEGTMICFKQLPHEEMVTMIDMTHFSSKIRP